jgi:cell wall-associated NlpC family hydrolase
MLVYRDQFNINLPRTTAQQLDFGMQVSANRAPDRRPGVLSDRPQHPSCGHSAQGGQIYARIYIAGCHDIAPE